MILLRGIIEVPKGNNTKSRKRLLHDLDLIVAISLLELSGVHDPVPIGKTLVRRHDNGSTKVFGGRT